MPDVDYSIASKIVPPNIDPLGAATKAVGLGQGMLGLQQGQLQNKLLGQQVGSKIALGRAVTGATNPQTGETDWNKALGSLSQDPEGSFAVPELAGQVLDRQIKQQQLSGVTLDTQAKRTKLIADTAGSLLADDKPLTKDGVVKGLVDNLVSSGQFHDPASVQQLTAFVQQLPDDDAGLRKVIGHYGQMADMTLSRIETQYAQQNAGLTPAQGATPTPILADGPNGTKVPATVPLAQYGKLAQGGPVATGPGMTAQGVPLATAGNPVTVGADPLTGAPKVATQGQVAASAAGAPVAGTGPLAPGQVAGPAAGVVEAANKTAASNVDQAQALQKRAAIVPQRKAALSNLMGTIDAFVPGPNGQLRQGASAALVQMGDTFGIKVPDSVRQGVASADEAEKLMAQIALDQWGALGGSGSNDQLATSVKANPHLALSRLGFKNVVPLLQGNEDAIAAQADAAQKYMKMHGGEASYGDFLAGWNRYYDPRVFQAQHMEPAAVKAMTSRMSPDELKKFNRDKSIAQQAGWLGGQ